MMLYDGARITLGALVAGMLTAWPLTGVWMSQSGWPCCLMYVAQVIDILGKAIAMSSALTWNCRWQLCGMRMQSRPARML